jgi:hypothetical protein
VAEWLRINGGSFKNEESASSVCNDGFAWGDSKMLFRFLMVFCSFFAAFGTVAKADIVLTDSTTSYTQDFDTLASTGATGTVVPFGWYFNETGTGANTSYGVGTGSSTTGNTYSFGASGSTERAFGGLLSGTVVPTIGARFINQGTTAIEKLSVSYRGELWRLGAPSREDRLDFEYSTDATSLSLTAGTWTGLSTLNFVTPDQTGTAGARDGNSLFTNLAGEISVTLNPNEVIWFRWKDFNVSGSDDGLAIDNFSVTASFLAPIPEPGAMLLTGVASLAIAGRRWMRRRSGV